MPNNGTIVGSPTFGACKFGNGLAAVSDANYITLPSGVGAAMASPAASFTIEAWLKTTDTTHTQLALWFGTLASNNLALFYVDSGRLTTYGTGSPGANNDSGVNVADGAWHHCALVVTNGTSWATFVDGVLCNTVTFTYTGLTGATTGILGRHESPTNPFNGSIDEVAIWSVAKYTGNFTPPTGPYAGTETGLVALYHLQSDATDSAGTPATTTIDPSDAGIIYSPFNWSVTSGYARSTNPGAYFRTIFSGTSLSILTDTSSNIAGYYPQLWVSIDYLPPVLYTLSAGNPALAVATGLPNRKHAVEVFIKYTSPNHERWTSPSSIVQITGLAVDVGAGVTAPPRRTKNVLFFGDSMSEGDVTFSPAVAEADYCNALCAFSMAACRSLDAEFGIVAAGGSGVTLTSSGGNVPPLATSYASLWSGVPRSFTAPAPDLVIFLEGFNDHGADIQAGMLATMQGILAAAPNAKMLVLTPFDQYYSSSDHTAHAAQLDAAVAAINKPGQVVRGDVSSSYNTSDTADGIHPLAYASTAIIGPAILALAAPKLYPQGRSYSFF